MQADLVPALHRLDAVDAFKLAIEQSNKTVIEIAQELGWSEFFMRRVFSPEKFFPSYADIPEFCVAVGNLTVIHWLVARTTFYGIDDQRQNVDCRSLLERVNSVFAEVGDVAQEARKAIADDMLDKHERRRLISERSDVLEGCMALVGDLREMDAHA